MGYNALPGRFLKSGDIAQLARACDWQSQGQGFDSPYLHKNTVQISAKPCKLNVYGVSCFMHCAKYSLFG